ncbi:MAG TPA: c-type cytochrome domain-containing protein [Polyangiales bacterium]|nr:c-type cytochrome domain-containing protein [Polyangiales bacterium]
MILRLLCCFALLAPLAACGGDDSDELPCVENLDAACVPGFPATWDNVYQFVIEQRCGGASGVSCHGPDGMKGGLSLYSKTVAYDGLVHGVGGEPRVLPKDPACSELMKRIETSDEALRMPLNAGKPLSAGDRCSIQQWIAAGAAQ